MSPFDTVVIFAPLVRSIDPPSTTIAMQAPLVLAKPASPKTLHIPMPPPKDVEWGGIGRVFGTVKVDGSPDYPVRKRVRLIRERDGIVIREQWSDDGVYSFDLVDERERYTVLATDDDLIFQAVAADNLETA